MPVAIFFASDCMSGLTNLKVPVSTTCSATASTADSLVSTSNSSSHQGNAIAAEPPPCCTTPPPRATIMGPLAAAAGVSSTTGASVSPVEARLTPTAGRAEKPAVRTASPPVTRMSQAWEKSWRSAGPGMGRWPSRSSKYSPKSCWDTHRFTSPSLDDSRTSRQQRRTCSTAHCTPPATSGTVPLNNRANVMVTPAADSGTPSEQFSPCGRKSSCRLRVACTPAMDKLGCSAIKLITTSRTSRNAGAVLSSCLASSSLAAPSLPNSSSKT
mmetsp:Transcript_6992/g.16698  ORF Transcript_6992/g.16698 Transcript_6992/m.16698 type:complete len:270 (-) Transcript_6992:899-1708(-)